MKTVKVGKHEVKFYNSPKDDLTIRRYSKYNKHRIISAEVGDSLEDYNKRHKRAITYIDAEDLKSAKRELINQQQCVFNAIEGYSPNLMACAIMVHSIDGNVYQGYSEDLLNEIIDKLDDIGFTPSMLNNIMEDVKKKSKQKSRLIKLLIFLIMSVIMSLVLIKVLPHWMQY